MEAAHLSDVVAVIAVSVRVGHQPELAPRVERVQRLLCRSAALPAQARLRRLPLRLGPLGGLCPLVPALAAALPPLWCDALCIRLVRGVLLEPVSQAHAERRARPLACFGRLAWRALALPAGTDGRLGLREKPAALLSRWLLWSGGQVLPLAWRRLARGDASDRVAACARRLRGSGAALESCDRRDGPAGPALRDGRYGWPRRLKVDHDAPIVDVLASLVVPAAFAPKPTCIVTVLIRSRDRN